MANLIHPTRATFLRTAIAIREEENATRAMDRAEMVDAHSIREHAAIRKWVMAIERGGRDHITFDELCAQSELIAELGGSVLNSDECAVFDASHLMSKIAHEDISSYCLDGLVLPGSSVIFIHFGCQDDLALGSDDGSYVEGAYIFQLSCDPDDDVASTVRVLLVKADPDFDQLIYTRTVEQTLRRNTDTVAIEICLGEVVSEVEAGFRNQPPVYLGDKDTEVYIKAFHHALRAAIYVSQAGADLQYGYQKDAPLVEVGQALNGVQMARTYLADEGFPEMLFAGRSPFPIARIEEPSWGSNRYMGGP